MKNYTFLSLFKKYSTASFWLIAATVVALICANVPGLKEWYFGLWSTPISLSLGEFNFFSHGGHPMSLAAFINDFLMAIFFLSVGLEIKREILVGELSSIKKAILPIIGACGGMLIPVLFFLLSCPSDASMMRGMAIPMATDIAFSLGVLAMFGKRVPLSLKIFLTTLAVADDLGGIIVIALCYTSEISWAYMALALLCIVVMVLGNRFRVSSKTFYLVAGVVLWFAMLNSGIHATISGVIAAFCIPACLSKGSQYYIERIRRNINEFPVTEVTDKNHVVVLTNDQIQTLKSIESASDHLISPLQKLEDDLREFINYLILPIFAFANAGVDLSGFQIGDLFSGVSLAVMLGLVAGKFVGVLSFSWLAIKLKIASMPTGCNWKAFASVCMLCGIGFTVSMFIADLSYSPLGADGKTLLDSAKLGILCGTIISALLGAALLKRNLPKAEENQA
ncbi:MAG: Na+/H+ antiporter NhaA [Tidjanibacter sp.]|nr:Na+/H+ antiporter NhaA [Tidjanibacter sp.]